MSTPLYHPHSKPLGLRDVPGCLTPNNSEEYRKMSSEYSSSAKKLVTEEPLILSPPLSPYQRGRSEIRPAIEEKSYLATSSQYKIENYKDYKMTIEPWKNLDASYKSAHQKFISQYQIVSSKSVPLDHDKKFVPRKLKRAKESLVSDADSDSSAERVRTRRAPKPSYYKTDSDLDAVLAAATPKKRKRNPSPGSPSLPQQQQVLIDESIPDLSPDPHTTLPAHNPKCLKVEWKGQPMDLTNDPNIDKLHPAEVLLASILRLPALVYLDSKRRLFYEKVQRVKAEKQFRRTDAQKACRIDVNKASRLFAAFEKVGWLNDDQFVKYK